MSIKIVDEPHSIGLARNHIWFTLQTDNHLQQQKSKPYVRLHFSSQALNQGDFLYLQKTYEDGTYAGWVSIIASNSPSSIYEFPITNQSLSDWLQFTFAPFLRNHPVISNWFSVDVSGNSIKLFHRDQGYISNYANFINNLTVFTVAGQIPKYRPNFEIGVRVFIWNGSYYELIDTSHYTPDINGYVTLDIAEILLTHLDYSLPPYIAQLGDEMIQNYFIQYYEFYGAPANIQRIFYSKLYRALLAGLPYHLFSGTFGASNFINGFIYSQRNFLTWKPYNRTVTPDQKEYLYYLYPEDEPLSSPYDQLNAYDLYATLYFEDGSFVIFEKLYHFDIGWQTGKVVKLPVGFDQNNIASLYPNKTVIKYEVYVGSDDVLNPFPQVISPVIRYKVDRLPYQHKQQFFFVNSLGGFDTIMTIAPQTKNLEVQAGSGRRIIKKGYNAIEAETFKYNKVGKQSYTARTGHLSREEMEWLQDLLINHQFCYTEIDGADVAINIIPDSYELYSEDESLFSLTFEYELAFDYNAYARQW